MILKNTSRNSILSLDLKEAKSLVDKSLGLLLKNNPRSMLFRTRFGIHTFFLKNSIDVVILDKNHKVIAAKTVQPNRIFLYNPIHSIVLELPEGVIKSSKTKIGDKLKLQA